jgi:hypothetical protein
MERAMGMDRGRQGECERKRDGGRESAREREPEEERVCVLGTIHRNGGWRGRRQVADK